MDGGEPRTGSRDGLHVLCCWALCLLLVLAVSAVLGPGRSAQAEESAQQIDGGFLWKRDCVSCHGTDGRGNELGPSIQSQGAAGVSLTITTGRMPLRDLREVARDRAGEQAGQAGQSVRGPVTYSQEEIDALVAYSSTILDGPDVPDVDAAGAELHRGAELFAANCAACHMSSGRGGALTNGHVAVSLTEATPQQVVEAMRTGLGTMPVFDEAAFGEQDADALAAYVVYLQDPAVPLGDPLGFLGPVSEGLVAWLVGIVALLLVVRWIGTRTPTEEADDG